MNLDNIATEIDAVKVEIFNPETPFGGVQIFGVTDAPIQVEFNTGSPVQSVFGRVGAVQALCGDYDQCYAASNRGIPNGGTTAQVLKKLSNNDYDVGWGTGGGGGAAPVTGNLIKGDNAGGFADAGIAAANVAMKQPAYPTPTTINEVIACLRAAGLCV